MRKTLLTTAALMTALSVSAFAQSPPPASTTTPSAAPSSTTAPVTASGQWQASKLIGLDVYNSQNEKIGDIKELLMDQSGKIDTVAIGVGGFLGVGTHDVAVKYDQLKFSDQPMRSAAADRPMASGANAPVGATTGAGDTRPSTNTAGSMASSAPVKKNYPDHAKLEMTKDQLKAMPAFDYTK